MNRNVLVERKILGDIFTRFVGLFLEAEQIQGIERVNGRHKYRRAIPIAARFADRLEIVVSPAILFIPIPRMLELGLHALGHFLAVNRRPVLPADDNRQSNYNY